MNSSGCWGWRVSEMWEPDRAGLLVAAAGEVLETMFFEEVVATGENPPGTADLVAARVGFRGSRSGTFRLWLPGPSAERLAAGFLGLDDAVEAAGRTGQVVSELANMVCGSVLSRLEAGSAFSLEAPALSGEQPGPDTVWAELGEEGFLGLSLELEAAG